LFIVQAVHDAFIMLEQLKRVKWEMQQTQQLVEQVEFYSFKRDGQ